MWRQHLPGLLKKARPPRGAVQNVTVLGEAAVPSAAQGMLGLGPKFCVPPQLDRTELLSLVRSTAARAKDEDSERVIHDGVDCLIRDDKKCGPSHRKLDHVVSSLKEAELNLLQSDKEGGFVIATRSVYSEKAQLALSGHFKEVPHVNPAKEKTRAANLCQGLGLSKLASSVKTSKLNTLSVFFSAKTHKQECPFRVIVSERGTWQRLLGGYLQKSLALLRLDDPYLIRRPHEVSSYFESECPRNVSAFSVDVRDLYYSLPKNLLCEEVSECIDRHGAVKFQNSCGVNVSHFLELLRFYLQSTFISHDNRLMVQKEGICIGSCLAPVLSDLLMARFDRSLMDNLDQTLTLKVFRYVDDYLIIFNLDKRHPRKLSELIFDVFKTQLQPLNLTNELPVDCKIRFLDMHFSFTPNHVCWSYEPRSKKALLPYSSAHSKLVKQGIANSCLKSALTRSCKHVVESSFLRQVDRLIDAGFPNAFIMSVAERLVRDLKKKPNVDSDQPEKKEKEKLAVIPYIHRVSHNVKRVAKKAGVKVVFSAPNKLSGLCKRVNAEGNKKPSCTKNHARKFVKCCVNVVYEIPFSPCGRCYVGQTGRCINDRLREHANTLKGVPTSHLSDHCRQCGCKPLFEKCEIIKKYRDQRTREISEAHRIQKLGDTCVSAPSLALLSKEISYLSEPLA